MRVFGDDAAGDIEGAGLRVGKSGDVADGCLDDGDSVRVTDLVPAEAATGDGSARLDDEAAREGDLMRRKVDDCHLLLLRDSKTTAEPKEWVGF